MRRFASAVGFLCSLDVGAVARAQTVAVTGGDIKGAMLEKTGKERAVRSIAQIVGISAFTLVSASGGLAHVAVPNFSPDGTTGWRAAGLFLRPATSGPQPVTVDKAYPFNPANGFPVVDVANPNLLPWVAGALRVNNERVLSGKALQQLSASCWPLGVPAMLQQWAHPVFIVQSTDKVLIIHETNHEVRHVYLNQAHSRSPKPSWWGESIGHYENGDTLVVDTIGMNDRTFVDVFRTPHTSALRVIERWKVIEDGRAMEVKVRIEDTGAFKAPYEVTQHYRRVEGPMLEYACGENSKDVLNEGLEPIAQDDSPDF